MKQSLFASWFETIASTATGFLISLGIQYAVCWWWSLPLVLQDNLAIIGAFTLASLLRGFAWRRLMERLHIRRPLTAFMQAVIAERYRQVEIEGWSSYHDDNHDEGELARAGAAYALGAAKYDWGYSIDQVPPGCWPWTFEWWKPAGFRRDLVKSAALILAEGERHDRNRKRKSVA